MAKTLATLANFSHEVQMYPKNAALVHLPSARITESTTHTHLCHSSSRSNSKTVPRVVGAIYSRCHQCLPDLRDETRFTEGSVIAEAEKRSWLFTPLGYIYSSEQL